MGNEYSPPILGQTLRRVTIESSLLRAMPCSSAFKYMPRLLSFNISVPVRGGANLLATALASIRQQRVPLAIALLDATPDNSVQVVANEYDDLIAYRYHHRDEGQAAAIRDGWTNTSGDICTWLNAD